MSEGMVRIWVEDGGGGCVVEFIFGTICTTAIF